MWVGVTQKWQSEPTDGLKGGWVFFPFCLSFSLSLCVSLSPSIYRATFLAIYLSTCLFMYLSIDLFIHLSIKLSIFLSIQPFIHPLTSLRTSLLKMPLVLRLPRKMHLCRSASNFPRLPSFLKMLQNPHVLVTFQWIHNPLHLPHKTTSERPKCLRDPQFLTLLTSKLCFAPQRRALFRHLNFQKCSETSVLTLFTSKCASRHNAVHFFVISTSKTAPNPAVFNTFYFQMCFAPQRRAFFQHLNFQKRSDPEVFCISLRNRLRATTACNFSSLISPDVSAPL